MSDERGDDPPAKFPLRTSGTTPEPGAAASEPAIPEEEIAATLGEEPLSGEPIAAPAEADAPAPAFDPPPLATLPPLGDPPLPDLAPIEPAGKRARKRRPLLLRLLILLIELVLAFVLLSVLMVTIYRFVAPPVTLTMIGDAIGGHSIDKQWMPLSRIDPNMARAAIAAEDSGFCSHSGFDLKAIEAAYERNAEGDKRIRGGSTISQQTAKNVFLWQGGGYFRKGLEAWFTVLIEKIWGKRRIMEVYLNVAETGIGTYGVNAGSLRYFGHDASRMSAQEAAQIAAVLPLPKKRPGNDPTGYTARYGHKIAARLGVVRNDGLDTCVR